MRPAGDQNWQVWLEAHLLFVFTINNRYLFIVFFNPKWVFQSRKSNLTSDYGELVEDNESLYDNSEFGERIGTWKTADGWGNRSRDPLDGNVD